MKTIKGSILALLLTSLTVHVYGQNALQFTAVKATSENAILLYWASNTNEIYAIDYADTLVDPDTGLTPWQRLYSQYPSHGTNTFVGDYGNYLSQLPAIPHPKQRPMRFYRVVNIGTNTAVAPTVSITSPTNGATANGLLSVAVNSSTAFPSKTVKLYIDGQEQKPSVDGTNFTINTCEWPSGSHTFFATARSQSGFAGGPGDTNLPVYGRAVSAYKTVTFDNLITRFAFSEAHFDPADGQTQHVSAVFAANANWTLEIQDVASNTVRTVTGSGTSLSYDWDGTGDGDTNIADGVYTYLLTASTNGGAGFSIMSSGGGESMSAAWSEQPTEWLAMPADGSGAAVPLMLYPPGADTNDLIIFEGSMQSSSSESMSFSESSGGAEAEALGPNTPTSQSSRAPTRPPTAPIKGFLGTFGVGYQTYQGLGAVFSMPPIHKTPPTPGFIAVDNWPAGASVPHGPIVENKDLGDNFIGAMDSNGWKPLLLKTEDAIGGSDLTGGAFNSVNVALISLHCSFGTASEPDQIFHTYLRFVNSGSHSTIKLADCSFGGSGGGGLKFVGLLACSALRDQNYNSMYDHLKLPINNDLHLLCSARTAVSSAPDIGKYWPGNMFGTSPTNGLPESVKEAWFDAGTRAYREGETNHYVFSFRVAGWPDAFSEYITDIGNTPGTGDPQDITKEDREVFNNP